MSENTFHIKATPPDCTAFNWMAQPFMPKVKPSLSSEGAREFEVTFNQAYVFDYAAGGKRIPVSGLTHTIGGEESANFTLKITFNHQDGAIQSAEILKDDSGISATFENFTAQSDIEGDGIGEISPAEYYLELAKMQGGDLEELYIRENIHLHIRGHYQKFDQFEDENGDEGVGYGVMKPLNSSLANGDIEYRALAEDPRENNDLEIRQEGNNIYFFVQGESSSG